MFQDHSKTWLLISTLICPACSFYNCSISRQKEYLRPFLGYSKTIHRPDCSPQLLSDPTAHFIIAPFQDKRSLSDPSWDIPRPFKTWLLISTLIWPDCSFYNCSVSRKKEHLKPSLDYSKMPRPLKDLTAHFNTKWPNCSFYNWLISRQREPLRPFLQYSKNIQRCDCSFLLLSDPTAHFITAQFPDKRSISDPT